MQIFYFYTLEQAAQERMRPAAEQPKSRRDFRVVGRMAMRRKASASGR